MSNLWIFLIITIMSTALTGLAFIARRSFIIFLLCIELILFAASLVFLLSGIFDISQRPDAFAYALLVLAMSAAESAFGLSLLVFVNRVIGDIRID